MLGHSLTSTWTNAFAGRVRSFGVWVTLESLIGAGIFAMYGRPILSLSGCKPSGYAPLSASRAHPPGVSDAFA
ncbi:hypothetical protein EV714DRAFT_244383, partial [Schizophyllum commune]